MEPPDNADARWCLDEYFRDLAQRFDTGFDPARSNPAADEDLTPPAGYFLVARMDGVVAGCGALKRLDAGIAEIKRMWTAPGMRGRGVARRVLQALETIARRVERADPPPGDQPHADRGAGAVSAAGLFRGAGV